MSGFIIFVNQERSQENEDRKKENEDRSELTERDGS